MAATRYVGTVNAPEFPEGLQWLNTDHPITLAQLRGKIVLLDFWTYCCINCMHVIPHLRRLEREFSQELVVIGVHSAKFDQERATEHIRNAILRYGVSHPVLNDADMRVWSTYGVRAWPTVMFLDPLGKVIGKLEGELTFEQGEPVIRDMVREFTQTGLLKPGPVEFVMERQPTSLLSFPGKVLADADSGRLFIADSGHHRILVADMDGRVRLTVGSGDEGLADGTLEGARFCRPQGMALDGEVLYVADTENHAIRRVDFTEGVVETIAGTGAQGKGPGGGGEATRVDLRSPWDLALVGRRLHVAMAGNHQLWVMDLDSGEIHPSVGSGAEAITDGPLQSASLAQPSGLAYEDGVLYFADSETSSIRAADMGRAADLAGGGRVTTLVGRGLFDFGDNDGDGNTAHLQHPLGLDVGDGLVYVADTYNSKIKRVGVHTRAVTTIAGSGVSGLVDGPLFEAQFSEPGGLSLVGGRLYVADTNNHAIRLVDLDQGQVTTLDISF